MTFADRLAAYRERAGICGRCHIRHSGAAWVPGIGWHDVPPVSPWVKRAQEKRLPVKEYAR